MIKIKTTKKYGRGVYATKNIKKGAIIEVCHLLVLSQKDTKLVNKTDLKWYTFNYLNKGQDCLVLGNGELYNHDDNANTSYQCKGKTMVFKALRDIKQGEQLFTDYNQDVKVDVKKGYKVNL